MPQPARATESDDPAIEDLEREVGQDAPAHRHPDAAPAAEAVGDLVTGGTLAGEDVVGGSILRGGGTRQVEQPPHSWDSIGREVRTDPERAGTVAGNTTAAGAVVAKDDEEGPDVDESDRVRRTAADD